MVTDARRLVSEAERILAASAAAVERTRQELPGAVAEVALVLLTALRSGGKVLFCGNGGSAADAQHLAAELAGRLQLDRPGLAALALTVNASILTAVANDFGYDAVFARQVEALGISGDVLVGISTSGSSANVVRALEAGRERGLVTVAMVGASGGAMDGVSDIVVRVPVEGTQHVQEAQIAVGHAICEIVEAEMFPRKTQDQQSQETT
ncbi:SIS domain-containing protein [bacterium]|nr:SIS domain-containing protein [bacterium]